MRYRFAFLTLIVAASCSSRSEDDIQKEFDAFVERNNACMVDADCTIVSPGCPLGCWVAVSESRADETQAKADDLIDDYESGGRACAYDCAQHGAVRCEAQHCTVDTAPPGGGCTLIGCASALQVTFEKASAWAAGDYRVVVNLDGTDVECTATLPLTCDAPFPCADPDVLLLLSGCALPASEHALGGIEIPQGTPATVSVEVFYQGQSVAVDTWMPQYVTSRPNGENCDPECTSAPMETMAIP